MKLNIGSTDSFVRVMIGLAFYVNIWALYPTLSVIAVIILFTLGTICIVTAWTESCPAYTKMGISTSSVNDCSCGCSTHQCEQ